MAVGARRPRIVDLVWITDLARVAVGASVPRGTVHGPGPLGCVDDQSLLARILGSGVTRKALLLGERRGRSSQRQSECHAG
jgi:hypothetical protein